MRRGKRAKRDAVITGINDGCLRRVTNLEDRQYQSANHYWRFQVLLETNR